MRNIRHIVYTMLLSLWVGGIAIFTFIVTPAIFRAFDRDTAGAIVDKLFPGYFLYVLVLSALAFLVYILVVLGESESRSRLCFLLLACALTANTYMAFKLHPDILAVKKQIASFEQESAASPARRQFSRLHAVSAVLNLLVLADGVALLVLATGGKKDRY